jgi:N-acetyl-gamma-glutamylphosphate reductase
MIDENDFWRNWWNENWQGKPKYSEKIYPSATLSTTKSHKTDPVSNPGPQRWEASD